jgi:hypothetical protein
MPHLFGSPQKAVRIASLNPVLGLVQATEPIVFGRLVTADESWSRFEYLHSSVFPASARGVIQSLPHRKKKNFEITFISKIVAISE